DGIRDFHVTGVQTCALPILARAFGRIAAADPDTPEGIVAHAIRTSPEFLGGTGRDVTALVSGVPGLIAKDGAEAVYAVGLADGQIGRASCRERVEMSAGAVA